MLLDNMTYSYSMFEAWLGHLCLNFLDLWKKNIARKHNPVGGGGGRVEDKEGLKQGFKRMSNICQLFVNLCRWSWPAAAPSITSTPAITWRWRSSSAWNFLRAEGCLCPRELSMKMGHPPLLRRRTLRRQNQVGKLDKICLFPTGCHDRIWVLQC